jgi:acetyl-CoA synthetase
LLILGASGGDMAMTADVSRELAIDFAPLPQSSAGALRDLLGSRVTVANPLDIHTYLWFDPPALKKVFGEIFRAGYDAAGFMLDCPPPEQADTSSFDAVIDAYIAAAQGSATQVALLSSLPETMSESVRVRCLAGGVAPLQGQREALEAMALAGGVGARWRDGAGVSLHRMHVGTGLGRPLTEHDGKQRLAHHGVTIPRGMLATPEAAAQAAAQLGFPVVMKASAADLEHKSEVGGVALNIRSIEEAQAAVERLSRLAPNVLVEEMLSDGVAEILVGVTLDPQFGQVLVVGSGGILTEVMRDSSLLLPPWDEKSVRRALEQLSAAKLMKGFRGKPAGDMDALVALILNVARFAEDHIESLIELDVNPIIVRPRGRGACAVDCVIRLRESS